MIETLAALGEERFERTGLVLVGTLRKDGWPRISPVEPFSVDIESVAFSIFQDGERIQKLWRAHARRHAD